MTDPDRRVVPAPADAPADRRLTLRGMPWRATLPAAAALLLGLGALLSIQLVARPLAYLVLAVAIAEALAPIVGRLERWRLPRALAIALVYLVLLAAAGGLGWLTLPPIIAQGQELIARIPELIVRVERWIERGELVTGSQLAAVLAPPQQLGAFLVSLPLLILSTLLDVLLVVFLSIYWLVGSPALERFALSLLPARRHGTAASTFRETGQAMGGYVRGVAINAVIMGGLAWLGFTLLGVDYALVLGVITMLGVPVPIIGPIVAAVPVVAIAFLQSPTTALVALAFYTGLQQVESQLLTPNIMRHQTDVPQTLVLFAVLAGGAVGGLLGILVSIPLAAALRVLVVRVVVPVVQRWTGAGAERRATGADATDEVRASGGA